MRVPKGMNKMEAMPVLDRLANLWASLLEYPRSLSAAWLTRDVAHQSKLQLISVRRTTGTSTEAVQRFDPSRMSRHH